MQSDINIHYQREEIGKQIANLYLNSNINVVNQITETIVSEANFIIDNIDIQDVDSVFLYLASLNLLNSAIKKKEFKKTLSYARIKRKATKLIRKIEKSEINDETLSVFYDKEGRCLYFKCFKIVFSFHNVPYDRNLILAMDNTQITWPGIRLQKIAVEVFSIAKEFYFKEHVIEKKSVKCSVKSLSDISGRKFIDCFATKYKLINTNNCLSDVKSISVLCLEANDMISIDNQGKSESFLYLTNGQIEFIHNNTSCIISQDNFIYMPSEASINIKAIISCKILCMRTYI